MHHVEDRQAVLATHEHVVLLGLTRDRNQLALESIDIFDEDTVNNVGQLQGAITADGSDLGAVQGKRGSEHPAVMIRDLTNLLAGCSFKYVDRVIRGSQGQLFAVVRKGYAEQIGRAHV